MCYHEIRIKQDLSYISICSLSILYNSKFILKTPSLEANADVVTRVHCISKGNNFFSFRENLFSEEVLCVGKLTASHNSCIPCKKMAEILKRVSCPLDFIWNYSICLYVSDYSLICNTIICISKYYLNTCAGLKILSRRYSEKVSYFQEIGLDISCKLSA